MRFPFLVLFLSGVAKWAPSLTYTDDFWVQLQYGGDRDFCKSLSMLYQNGFKGEQKAEVEQAQHFCHVPVKKQEWVEGREWIEGTAEAMMNETGVCLMGRCLVET